MPQKQISAFMPSQKKLALMPLQSLAFMPQNLVFTPSQNSAFMPTQISAFMSQNQNSAFTPSQNSAFTPFQNSAFYANPNFGSHATKPNFGFHAIQKLGSHAINPKFGFHAIKNQALCHKIWLSSQNNPFWQKSFTKWYPFDQRFSNKHSHSTFAYFQQKKNLSETRGYQKKKMPKCLYMEVPKE